MKKMMRIFKSKINPYNSLISKEFFVYVLGLKFGVTFWNQNGVNKGNHFGFYKDSMNLFKITISWDSFYIKRVDRHLTGYYK